jgi:hypothetical protein
MPRYTIFYWHPRHCQSGNHYIVDRTSARIAADEAAESLADDWVEDEMGDEFFDSGERETLRSLILDDLDLKVYEGDHDVQPGGEPTCDWAVLVTAVDPVLP